MSEPDIRPALSIVIVTLHGLDELAVALPGILSQTIAGKIELVIVAGTGKVSADDFARVAGLHAVRLVERPAIGSRSRDAAAGVAVASAPFVALHENHTRAEPATFENLLAAFRPDDAAICPVIYPANGEMAWGNAMYAVAHADAAPPNDAGDKDRITLHSAVYRTELLRACGDRLSAEPKVQAEFRAMGKTLRFLPGTVMWHINEARPKRVMIDGFALGRGFGFGRSRQMGAPERLGRAALFPAIAAMNLLRCMSSARRSAATREDFLRAIPAVGATALAFAAGEVRGYFDRRNPWTVASETHEYHVRGRLNGQTPAARWLAEAIRDIPEGAP